jgi:leader peptidase (prepilin peptidase)/N-methyltransferase
MIPDTALLIIVFVFGAAIGSFLNVVILRLPDSTQSIVFPASHCPQCSTPLRWYENIPIISYIVLRGRCGHCQKTISFQYPIVELLTGLLASALIARYGLTSTAFGYFLFSAALVVVIFIDIHHQIIPDVISLPAIVLGFLFSFITPILTWQESLIGLLVGGGILYAIAIGYAVLRKIEGMGGGDIKLLAAIGAWLGWKSLFFVIMIASFSGLLVGIFAMIKQGKGARTRIPFGPFLSLGAFCYIFFREQLLAFLYLYVSGQWP